MIEKIKQEINDYKNGSVKICDNYSYSAHKLIRRILLFKNKIYPTGKTDSQGNYKYWFDIISPRVDSEIKNIDFDTKDVRLVSDGKDVGNLIIANNFLQNNFQETGQAEKFNEFIERGVEWGNLVWKKIKGGYKIMELDKFYVLNQAAETLEDSDIIEMEIMTASDLRKKIGIWKNVENLIKEASAKNKTEFYIYERNGEINEKEYNRLKDKEEGDENKHLLTKIIGGGIAEDNPEQILFCEEIDEKPYKEYHRGRYSGRWIRVGMYEILFDIQIRANEIGNQIARGLEWAAKAIFRSSDRIIAQNILTDLQNGDIIKSADLTQVNTRMDGLDQLIADWNRLMQLADKLANSFEVITGETLPSGTPFSLGNLMNINANKLFDFIREKLSVAFQEVIEDWILPDVLQQLKSEKIVKLMSDSEGYDYYLTLLVNDWYIRNLIALPPHTPEIAANLKNQKIEELKNKKELLIKLEKEMWDNFKPRVKVVITGENYNLISELETLKSFIQLEQDPVRRTALIEMAMSKKGIDVNRLPKTPPQVQTPTKTALEELVKAKSPSVE